jgi:uncharacterized protein (TIGR04255 family)
VFVQKFILPIIINIREECISEGKISAQLFKECNGKRFRSGYYEVSSAVPGALQEKVKERFPFMQRKAAMAEQLQVVSETEIKRRHVKENHWFFQAKDGSSTLCIAPNFLWIDYKKYSDFGDLKDTFSTVVDGLFEGFPNFSVNRFASGI